MKKFVSFLVAGIVAIAIPMVASAAEITGSCDQSKPCTDGTTNCTATCTIMVTGNSTSLTTFTGTLTASGENVTITNVTAGDGWSVASPTTSDLGKSSVPISFYSTNGVSSSNFTLLTATLSLPKQSSDCSLSLTNVSTNTNVGSGVTVEVTTTTTTSTGASLPIALLACGACVAVIIYLTTKKSKKMYKI